MTLGSAMRSDNPKQDNVAIALVLVAGVTLLDFVAAGAARGPPHAAAGGAAGL